jgi:hypothetical protein
MFNVKHNKNKMIGIAAIKLDNTKLPKGLKECTNIVYAAITTLVVTLLIAIPFFKLPGGIATGGVIEGFYQKSLLK